jgi:predicted ribosome quality control (RQC) complex YloA/Tae2 family protein
VINFDTIMLACATRELQDRIVGARVERVSQPIAHATQWTLYTNGPKVTLLIETDAVSSRIHLTRRGRQNPPNPPAFCMLLRKLLDGAWLEGIDRPLGFGERVARLMFQGDDDRRYGLYVELMGRHGNQILVSDNGMILGSIKRVTPEMSRFREIRAGIPYIPPPRQRGAKRDVFSPVAGNDLPPERFESAAAAEEWSLKTFSGISPLMAREGVARVASDVLDSESVWFGINDLINHARLADYAPVLLTDDLGRITSAYPVALKTVPTAQQPRAKSFCEAIDEAADSLDQRSTFEEEKTALIAALRKARRVIDSGLLDIEEGLANSDRADEYRTAGELIAANQSKIRTGIESAMLLDYETGEDREVELDPTLNAQQNADRYFKKYRKARDARERLEQRRTELEERSERVEAAMPLVDAAASVDAVQALAAGFDDICEVADQSGGPGDSSAAQPPNPYPGYKVKTFHSVDGWEILVGENAESNDFITTRIASPSDIWLHARAQVSAHAIIRSCNRPAAVSTAALRYAAEQVAKRSTAKHSRLVPVDYTLRKYVRKPRGAKPGQVQYSREKTLDVVADAHEIA